MARHSTHLAHSAPGRPAVDENRVPRGPQTNDPAFREKKPGPNVNISPTKWRGSPGLGGARVTRGRSGLPLTLPDPRPKPEPPREPRRAERPSGMRAAPECFSSTPRGRNATPRSRPPAPSSREGAPMAPPDTAAQPEKRQPTPAAGWDTPGTARSKAISRGSWTPRRETDRESPRSTTPRCADIGGRRKCGKGLSQRPRSNSYKLCLNQPSLTASHFDQRTMQGAVRPLSSYSLQCRKLETRCGRKRLPLEGILVERRFVGCSRFQFLVGLLSCWESLV